MGTLLACLGAMSAAWAAVQVPPEVENSEPEVKARYMGEQADKSLQEKLEVGKQRYEQRKAFRSDLVANLRANTEQRREIILGENQPAVAEGRMATGLNWPLLLCWLIAGAGGSLLFNLVRRTRKRTAETS